MAGINDLISLYPNLGINIGEQGLGEGYSLGTKDISYGGALIGEGDNIYGGIDYLKMKNKIDFMRDNVSEFKDSSDAEIMDFIMGYKTDDMDIRLRTDKDLLNTMLTFSKRFAKGGIVNLL